MLSRKSKTRKVILTIGFILFVLGIIFNKTLGLTDTPEFFESTSLPMIIIGVIMLVASNFLKNSEGKT